MIVVPAAKTSMRSSLSSKPAIRRARLGESARIRTRITSRGAAHLLGLELRNDVTKCLLPSAIKLQPKNRTGAFFKGD